MPRFTNTERRAQRRRDYALQIAVLRKQAYDNGCTISAVRMVDSDDEHAVWFYVYHRLDADAREIVKVTAATFLEAFRKASACLPAAIEALLSELEEV